MARQETLNRYEVFLGDYLEYTKEYLLVAVNKEAAIKDILFSLAASQVVDRDQKDVIRRNIKSFYRNNYGDSIIFADSDLHRKHKREKG